MSKRQRSETPPNDDSVPSIPISKLIADCKITPFAVGKNTKLKI